MSYSKIRAYLQAHPTPWKVEDVFGDRPGYDSVHWQAIVDANGNEIVSTLDKERYKSWFEGGVGAVVEFVNLVGEEYEPQHGWDTYNHTADPRWPEELRPFTPEQRQAIADSWEPPNWDEGPLERFVRGHLDGEDK